MDTYSDLLEAESSLYGDFNRAMTTHWKGANANPKLNDMADAWLEGRHDEVHAYVAAHFARLRSDRCTLHLVRKVQKSRGRGLRAWGAHKPIICREKVRELRERGWKLSTIAKMLKCSKAQVGAICQKLNLPRLEDLAA